jgi:hypothetical protein
MNRQASGIVEIALPTQQLTPADHARFIEVPFELPADAESLVVRCSVPGQDHAGALVDLGLRDPDQIRGWSGGARSELVISPDWTTPGYLPGALPPGRWAVLLASNRIPAPGCQAALTVTYTRPSARRADEPGARWLVGDLHMHSVHSDGSYALAEVIRLCETAGLDFISITDHNTISQNTAPAPPTTLTCIPGVELTTYRGHSNLLGVTAPVADFRVSSQAELDERLAYARQQGARIVLNHPFDPGCGWQWDWQVDYDWFEVWNGPWRESNQQALDWWQAQLAAGRRLTAVAGSDTHRPHQYVKHGYPSSWVYSASRAADDILAAIAAGHLVLSYAPDGPRIELCCEQFMVGDVVPAELEQLSMTLRVTQLAAGDTVKIISEQGVEREQPIAAGASELELSWIAESRRFYRVEIWRYFPQVSQMLVAALSNPIYFA